MRQIGHLETEEAARTFSDYLYVQGIENQIEAEKGHGWAIWIHSEEHLDKAREQLAAFRQNPADLKYEQQRLAAAKLRQEEARAEAHYAKKVKTSRQVFRSLTSQGFGPLTTALIAASIVVFVLSDLGHKVIQNVPALFITNLQGSGVDVLFRSGLADVRDGQVWRLVTPIFIHFDFLHIFFNMLWLYDLGSMVEARQGTVRLGLLVLVIAILSNLAQFAYAGPVFGGMSGVVYGLVGYIWMRGKHDPASGLFLHPWTVAMAGVWFLLCLIQVVPAANAAHAVGLAVGAAWGYLSALRRK